MAVLYSGCRRIDRDGIEIPVAHPVLRHDCLRELRDCLRRAAQYHRLDAVVVIKMSMHCRDCDVVVVMLHACQSARKLALMVVVHVAEGADAILRRTFLEALFS